MSYIDPDANVIVGQVLREMREDAGLTIIQAEERSGFQRVRIGSWERGERTAMLDCVHALCLVYEVPLSWFLDVVQRRMREVA